MFCIIYLKLLVNLAFPQSNIEDCDHFYKGNPIITPTPREVEHLVSTTKVPLELLQPKKDIIDFDMLKN